MRKQQAIIFVSLLMGAVAAAAQAPSQLDRVNVIRDADNVRIEMTASGAVTPKLSKLDSPERVVIDLPETVMATGQSHIPVGTAYIKGVRIGMNGQDPRCRRPGKGVRL
jgi:AMIN domain